MLSLHAVRAIRATSLDSSWIELTFEGYDNESLTLCLYAWTGSEDARWPNKFIEALKRGIEALPPTPPPAHLSIPDPPEEVTILTFADPKKLRSAIAEAVGEPPILTFEDVARALNTEPDEDQS